MEATLSHLYVSKPVDAARRAWNEFVGRDSAFLEPPEGVHFIPAQGGCFVVALAPRGLSWPAGRHGRRKRVTGRHLQRFGRFLEQPKASQHWRDRVSARGLS